MAASACCHAGVDSIGEGPYPAVICNNQIVSIDMTTTRQCCADAQANVTRDPVWFAYGTVLRSCVDVHEAQRNCLARAWRLWN